MADQILKSMTGNTSNFNKTMPNFGGFNSLMSPKKMSSYQINNLDSNNETAMKLKSRLQEYLNKPSQGHQTQEILYSLLTEMLNKAALTKDKAL